jgi:3-isopropylmalate/(R)-2-methylmalate dehydratase large subunit
MDGTTEIDIAGPRTFFEKVWSDHFIADLGDNTHLLQIDRLFLHELSGSVTIRELQESKRVPNSPKQVFAVIDHVVSTAPGRGPNDGRNATASEMIQQTRRAVNEMGFTFFDVGDPRQGIVHVVSPELGIALPGLSLVCGDSHTCTVGAVGALAWGIGSTEGIHVLATGTLQQVKPKTMRITFEGTLPLGVTAKDLILSLIGRIGANGGIGYAVEFAGPVVRAMSIEERLTLCNMAIEFSAKYGFVPPDEKTFEYLLDREFAPKGAAWDRAVEYWRSLPTDAGATFDRELTIDCSTLQPQVTWGTSPQHVINIDGTVPAPQDFSDAGARTLVERALEYQRLQPGMSIAGMPVDVAYIGACTNARLSDLRNAAAILRGRKVAPGVLAICVPGSTKVKADAEAEGLDKVFIEAGFEWHESGCAMCGNGGAQRLQDLRVISTTNRNFEGRQGPRTRTHLASPATVAATAVAGVVTDPRRLPPAKG